MSARAADERVELRVSVRPTTVKTMTEAMTTLSAMKNFSTHN
jgi:hypothetical protein